jgi:hypothetical protein
VDAALTGATGVLEDAALIGAAMEEEVGSLTGAEEEAAATTGAADETAGEVELWEPLAPPAFWHVAPAAHLV